MRRYFSVIGVLSIQRPEQIRTRGGPIVDSKRVRRQLRDVALRKSANLLETSREARLQAARRRRSLFVPWNQQHDGSPMQAIDERSGRPEHRGYEMPSATIAQRAIPDAPSTSKDRSRGTLTKQEIAQVVSSACPGISRREAKTLVEAVLEEIVSTLVAGDNVNLRGFGKFTVRHKREPAGRNPKTGVVAPITARRVVTFKASQFLKTEVDEE
jgi:integration host factor subunit alpha